MGVQFLHVTVIAWGRAGEWKLAPPSLSILPPSPVWLPSDLWKVANCSCSCEGFPPDLDPWIRREPCGHLLSIEWKMVGEVGGKTVATNTFLINQEGWVYWWVYWLNRIMINQFYIPHPVVWVLPFEKTQMEIGTSGKFAWKHGQHVDVGHGL